MTTEEFLKLGPGDIIRTVPRQYQIVKIDPWTRNLIVRDLLGHETTMVSEFVEDWMEKVDHG